KCDPTFNFTISKYNNCRCSPPTGDEGTCGWTEWGEWIFSSCMQSDIQETDGTVVGSCPEYGRRTCNRTRTCTCPTNVGDSQCVGASIQHKSEQCCRLKEEECPPEGDQGYGGNPPTSCCMDGKWYVPLGGRDYTIREVSDDKPIPMKCDPTFNFTISKYNNCRCSPP
ncbi:unnamed protein product, partial [Owenia fusiformis]